MKTDTLNQNKIKHGNDLLILTMCETADLGGGTTPRPRCLAALPSNIEELIDLFKSQGEHNGTNQQTHL